jgi:hypothetical protein
LTGDIATSQACCLAVCIGKRFVLMLGPVAPTAFVLGSAPEQPRWYRDDAGRRRNDDGQHRHDHHDGQH